MSRSMRFGVRRGAVSFRMVLIVVLFTIYMAGNVWMLNSILTPQQTRYTMAGILAGASVNLFALALILHRVAFPHGMPLKSNRR